MKLHQIRRINSLLSDREELKRKRDYLSTEDYKVALGIGHWAIVDPDILASVRKAVVDHHQVQVDNIKTQLQELGVEFDHDDD